MKNIAVKEVIEYKSDVSGKVFGYYPEVELTVVFGYGSKLDGESIQLHFTDDEFIKVLPSITKHLSIESYTNLTKIIKEYER